MTAYRFNRRLSDGSTYRLGVAVEYPDGWRFISNVASRRSGRKYHATMEKCLPRWLGHPDRCESEAVEYENEMVNRFVRGLPLSVDGKKRARRLLKDARS